jgi:hypothetical protein
VAAAVFSTGTALAQRNDAPAPPPARARADTAAVQRSAVVRTLEAINIEGEIAVPQVLFITSRDYPRYRDRMRWRYRMSSLDVARSLELPTRLRIVAQPEPTKEAVK